MVNWGIIILAAGKGTRMMSSTPKILQKLCGKEMLNLVLTNVCSVIDGEYIVVVPPEFDLIKKAVNRQVKYVVQNEPRGTGDAVNIALKVSNCENIFVINGDVPLIESSIIDSMVTSHVKSKAAVTLLTSDVKDPNRLGRIIRDKSGTVKRISEVNNGNLIQSGITTEINSGVYCFNKNLLESYLNKVTKSQSGEVYLTDVIELLSNNGELIDSIRLNDAERVKFGIDSKYDLEIGNAYLRDNILTQLMLEGVTIEDRRATYIDWGIKIGKDSIIKPNTHIIGDSRIGANSIIGPNSIVASSNVGDDCNIGSSTVNDSVVCNNVVIGPFSNVRNNSYLDDGVHLGTSAEVNRSRLGKGTKSSHFSYLGDAEVGNQVNIGAGTITCNYDGKNKNKTIIGDGALIGSDTMLIAPIKIGNKSSTGAGAVVIHDVDDGARVVGVPAKHISKQS